ncbi:MAG: tetratricopeptide repeat protein [Alphaproteobacteria bacterium]|nr:tetratricopeptide repeat protein [Alphaproteobacteria bacterium]
MQTDRYGLALSTRSSEAAAAYRAGIDLMLSAWPGAAARLDEAIAADPEFALAHVARARVHQGAAQPEAARAAAARARAVAAGATGRERGHIEVIARAVDGDAAGALAAALEHLDAHPRDALVFTLPMGAFGLLAFSGRADHDAARVALCEKHARHYGDDWWFLATLGWSHAEAGSPGAGRQLVERSLERRGANANAAHALSHALIELGDAAAGIAALDLWLPGYDRNGALHGHLSWHRALLALDAGDMATASAIYRDTLAPAAATSPPLNVFTDAAALLWRMMLLDATPAPETWREVAVYGEARFPAAGVHFADLHHALAAGALHDAPAMARRLEAIEAMRAAGKLPPGAVLPALYRGLAAFAAGDMAAAIAILEPQLPDVVRVGGSHAQRELIEDTLIVACLRAGQRDRARSLLGARLARRPAGRDAMWMGRTA